MAIECHNLIMALIISHQFSSTTVAPIAPLSYSVQRPLFIILLWYKYMSLSILLNDFFVVVNLSLDLQAINQLEVVLQLA
jgi:hypothetical protein